jgi:hypothetical protein
MQSYKIIIFLILEKIIILPLSIINNKIILS